MNLNCTWPPYLDVARFFLFYSSSRYVCSTFGRSFLIRRSKSKNCSTKWQSLWRIVEWSRRIILSLPTDFMKGSVLHICSHSKLIHLFICSSFAKFHNVLRSAFGLLRKFLYSLTIPAVSLSILSQTQHLEDVLSQCWCHERSDQSHSSQGVYGMMRVPRNLDPALYHCLLLVDLCWFVVNCLWVLSVPLFESWLS